MFCKKAAFKTYTELTGKHLFWSLFLIKFQGFRLVNVLKRDSETGVCFPVNLLKFLRTPILESICKLLLLHIKYYTEEFITEFVLVVTILERLDKKMHEDFMWFS